MHAEDNTAPASAATPIPEERPVNFFSIEFASRAPRMWESLARLLFTLAGRARRKGVL